MRFSESDIQRAREYPLANLLTLKQGRQQKVRCPFHGGGKERTPSLTIYRNGGYHCFGCGKNGNNSIDFIMHLGMNFNQAVEYLLKL
jgi:DNA primase